MPNLLILLLILVAGVIAFILLLVLDKRKQKKRMNKLFNGVKLTTCNNCRCNSCDTKCDDCIKCNNNHYLNFKLSCNKAKTLK